MRNRTPEERLARAATFNRAAELYERARPTYPDAVYEALWQLASLGSRPIVAEIGCGTGQASTALAGRGCDLTCIEYGENMAALARKNLSKFPSARVIVSKFEDWEPGDMRFDLLFAAASWHWIDPERKYAKAASVLNTTGSLAIVNSDHAYPADYDRLYDPIQEVYGEVTGSRLPWPPKKPEDIPDNREEVLESGRFESVSVARVLWHFERTADDYIALLGTYSDNAAMDPEKRDRLFEHIHGIISASPAGRIRKHYLTTIRVGHEPVPV